MSATDPEYIYRARQLRRPMTPAEKILWRHLRGRRFAGFKFRRQQPVMPFIVDFYCHQCHVVVEVDGETHLGKEVHDEKRTKFLEGMGLVVLRFWNTQVYDELEPVLERIYQVCVERNRISTCEGVKSNPSPPGPLPKGEGG